MLSRKSVTIIAALASASLLPSAAYAAPADPVELAAEVEALLDKSFPDGGPGAAIVVTENGKVIYQGGQGLADVEAGTPITPDTVFRFASITKQFAAATMLQLVQESKLRLDDPLSKFFADYPEPGASATVRQLLNHTSGIQSYTGIAGWMSEAKTSTEFTTEELIAEFKDAPANFQPGEAFRYNNSGYVLVGAIIEKVTGQSWDQAIIERISNPLGLPSLAGFGDEAQVPGMANGYTTDDDGNPALAQKIHMSVPVAAGALRGTVLDMAKWADALHSGKVVSQPYYEAMIAPTQLPGGKTENYGFGIAPSDIRGLRAIGHNGGIFGFSTDSTYLPEEGIFVAVFANSDDPATDPGLLMRKVAALAIDDPFEEFTAVTPDLDALASQFGVYRINEEDTRKFYTRAGKLFTQRTGGSDTEIFTAENDRFFYGPDSLTWFEITTGKDGVLVMEMHQNGASKAELATYDGQIVAEEMVTVSRETLESYVGTYTTMAGQMVITVTDANVLMGKLGGQPTIPLAAMSETKFKVTVVDATVTFTSEDGAVTGLVIEQGGQSIPGVRVAETD